MLRPTSLAVQCIRAYGTPFRSKFKIELCPKRQNKIMKKFMNDRKIGPGGQVAVAAPKLCTSIKQFGNNRNLTGEANIRRLTVLNKLFMTNITDILATGELSQVIFGRGLQITHVKMAPAYNTVNVYWMCPGAMDDGEELEAELQRCAEPLRHELSRLKLMGHVPQVCFVRDKMSAGLLQVESILKTIGPELACDDDDDNEERFAGQSQRMEELTIQELNEKSKRRFALKLMLANEDPAEEAPSENEQNVERAAEREEELSLPQLPAMRHDVFGLDHHRMAHGILLKLHTAKQAWDQQRGDELLDEQTSLNLSTQYDEALAKRKQAQDDVYASKFDDYLKQERSRRMYNIKKAKYKREDHVIPLHDI